MRTCAALIFALVLGCQHIPVNQPVHEADDGSGFIYPNLGKYTLGAGRYTGCHGASSPCAASSFTSSGDTTVGGNLILSGDLQLVGGGNVIVSGGSTLLQVGGSGTTAGVASIAAGATPGHWFYVTTDWSGTQPVFRIGDSNASVHLFEFMGDGYLKSSTADTLFSAYPNALLTAITMAGHALPAHAFTVTDVTMYVSVASSATVANTVWTISDGTNTCTATFACNTSTNTTGTKTVATANGAGTGCVYAASAVLTLAVTTQGCATAATVKNVDVVGKWQ